ncbi:MAG: carbon storage regulator CsrA [Clostridiaceae bacterium]|nr:carbon storage regulator CsrA [Clostridiaceae bacterium]
MLVLSRKKNQSIMIGEDIEIIITDVSDDKVRIGIKAPKSLKIFRKELIEEIQEENIKSNLTLNVDINELTNIINK